MVDSVYHVSCQWQVHLYDLNLVMGQLSMQAVSFHPCFTPEAYFYILISFKPILPTVLIFKTVSRAVYILESCRKTLNI